MSKLFGNDALRAATGICALAITLAGCAPAPVLETDDDIAPRRVFAAGLENLSERYIDRLPISDLSIAGLSNLATIDPALQLERKDGRLRLVAQQRPVAEWREPARGGPYEWASLMGDVLDAARKQSPALRAKTGDQIYDAVFKGVLKGTDRYTHYDNPDTARRNRESRDGFGGIGVTIRVDGPATTVTEVTPDTPASRARLQLNDRIVSVNGRSIVGATQDEVIDALRGPIESTVALGIERGSEPPLSVSLVRARIVPTTVTVTREGELLHVKLSGFNSATASELRRQLTRIERSGPPKPRGIVLDLRGNPGGRLDQAVAVADVFLRTGRIIWTMGRHPDSNQYFDANRDEWLAGIPMVVIVNGRSASAAEIVAASLRDRGRAVLLGSSSFGKGSVQTIVSLPNGADIVMTWARIHAPSGRALQDMGVVPAICTNSEGELVGALVAALKGGEETGRIALAGYLRGRAASEAPIAQRRAACPPAIEENAKDMELARLIAGNERLYQRALGAEQPAVAANAPARP